MKNIQSNNNKGGTNTNKQNVCYNVNKHRPEIRDDLDSREGEEQHYKGDDVTHNKKDHKSKGSGTKK
jgi:hypothetical protein